MAKYLDSRSSHSIIRSPILPQTISVFNSVWLNREKTQNYMEEGGEGGKKGNLNPTRKENKYYMLKLLSLIVSNPMLLP